jgi:hypothetical protein
MRRYLLAPSAALLAVIALGCSEQSGPLEAPNDSHPSFRNQRSPEGPGALGIHVPEGFFGTTDDGLTTVVGVTFAEVEQFCTTGDFPTILDRFLVFRPDGSIKTWVKGVSVPIVVWQAAPPPVTDNFFANICADEFLALPHLEGTAQFHDSDNDLTGSGNRGNAFGPHIVGKLTSESGDRFKFLALIHTVLLRNGETRLERVDLRLRAIGG